MGDEGHPQGEYDSHVVDWLFARAENVILRLPMRRGQGHTQNPDLNGILQRVAWGKAATKLIRIGEHAPAEKRSYFLRWASDALIGMGALERALQTRPVPELGTRRSAQADNILSLKCALGRTVSGYDIGVLFGPRLTRFGRSHLEAIIEYVDAIVTAHQVNEGRNLLREWSLDAYRIPGGFPLFAGVASSIVHPLVVGYSFSLSKTAEAYCLSVLREGEDTFREERGIAKVGKGWIAETELFYLIKAAHPGEVVEHHARPPWLGRQHLDIYLPGRGVALEYQGAQHDRAVEFFGGEEAFQATLRRDERKRHLCRKYGVRLIYVREGYDPAKVISEVSVLSHC